MKISLQGACQAGKTQLYSALKLAQEAAVLPATILMNEPLASDDSDLTFLMGLDTHNHDQFAADQLIRSALSKLNIAYDVLYGSTDERVVQALRRIKERQSSSAGLMPDRPTRTVKPVEASGNNKAWVWACDKCSDPQCEHKLLTDLLVQRKSGQAAKPSIEPYLKTVADGRG